MSLLILLYACAVFVPLTFAIPTITFPLNSQVPPVARTLQPFSYIFSPSTFSSQLPLTYNLTSGPEWLMLDETTRTLHGIPSENFARPGSVTGIPISIAATDSTGSTLMKSTLVVTNKEIPSVKTPAALQLPSFGQFSHPSALLYHPSSSFDFKFDRNTFFGNGLQYYAVADGNTPLPSWVIFDSKTLSFIGRTPDQASLTQRPQTFRIRLIASDVEGFDGISISFEIKVGVHLLTILQEKLVIEAVMGEKVDFRGLSKTIQVDGRQAERGELESVIVNTPTWLDFDKTTLAITGTVPKDVTDLNITFNVTDIYKNTIAGTILVDVAATTFFKAMVGNLNATVGCGFWYDLSSYLMKDFNSDIGVDFLPMQTWISFDSTKLTISGVVPETFSPIDIVVTLHAKSNSSQAVDTQTFKFIISESPIRPPSSRITVISATSKPVLPKQPTSRNLKNSGIIAISIPLAVLFLTILLAILCHLHRKKRKVSSCFTHISKSDISLPQEQKQSNMLEIIILCRSPTPEPLHLDMSGFGISDTTSPVSPLSVTSFVTNPIREPKNLSTRPRTLSEQQHSKTLETPCNYWEIPISKPEEVISPSSNASLNWTSTPDSNDPTPISSKVNYSHRLLRRYSRKHRRHPATTLTSNDIRPLLQSTISRPTSAITRPPSSGDQSGINLQDIDFSFLQPNYYIPHSAHGSKDFSQLVKRPKTARSPRSITHFVPDFFSYTVNAGRDCVSSLSTQPPQHHSNMVHQDSFTSFTSPSSDSLSIGIASTIDLSHKPNTKQLQPYLHISTIPPRNPSRPKATDRSRPLQTLTLQTQTSLTSTTTNSNWMRTLNSFADSPTMPMSTSHSSSATSSSAHFSGTRLDIASPPSQSQNQSQNIKCKSPERRSNTNTLQKQMQARRSTISLLSNHSEFESAGTSLLDFPLPPGSETHFSSSEVGLGQSVSHQSVSTWQTHDSSSFNEDEEAMVVGWRRRLGVLLRGSQEWMG